MGWFSDGLDWWDKNVRPATNAGWKAVMDLIGLDDADAKRAQSLVSDIPIIGDALQLQQRHEQISDYLDNKDMDWSDVKYPALLGGTGVGRLAKNAKNFVSNNVENLYKD